MAASDSDDAFDFVLQELGAQQGIADDPQAEDSDREMDRMLEVVREGHRDRYSRRGFLLCQYMRKCKLVSSLSQQPKVAQHIQDLISRYNKESAKTLEEVIDLSEKKRTVMRGRGAYKRWLPAAPQRACWGLKPRKRINKRKQVVRRRLRGKRRPQAPAAPTTASTRVYAVFTRSSGKYVQDIRNAVCERFFVLQAAALERLPRDLDTIVMELAFDEKEEPITMGEVRSETVHIMTIHARIFHRKGSESSKIELAMAPAILDNTRGENLKAALLHRLPWSLHAFQARCMRFTLVLNTDSAPACLRLGRHLSESVCALPAPCKMHQGCLAMSSIFVLGGIMSAMFCAALLLRRRRVQALLRATVKAYISKHLVITHAEPSLEDQAHSRAVFAMIHRMIAARLQAGHDTSKPSPRMAAWRRLRRALRGPLGGVNIVHCCPWGCHATRKEAAAQISADFITLFLDHPPPVPAFNKLTKLVPPLLWFATATAFNTIMPGIMKDLCALREGQLEEYDDDAAVGLDTQKAYLQQDLIRFRKTQKFLSAQCTADKLMACSLTLLPFLYLMNKCFQASRRFEANTPGVLMFIHSDSPAKCLDAAILGVLV